MESNIYYKCILKKKIKVEPKYLNENLDKYIVNFLQNKIEGKCMDEGYIRPESIKLLKRSAGQLLGSRFTGDITYEAEYSAEVCNPSFGSLVDARVQYVTKVGIMCLNGPLSLFVPKKNHENNLDNFLKIKIGDMVRIEIESKKFSLNDTQIQVTGKIYGMKNKKNKINEVVKNKMEEAKFNKEVEDSDKEFDMDDENDIDDMEVEDSEEEEESDEESESEDELENPEEEQVDEFIAEANKIGNMDNKEFGDDFEEADEDYEDDMDDGDDDDGGYDTE
jgi:DNA-directed RNA polymerase subunit E'/Rpb7